MRPIRVVRRLLVRLCTWLGVEPTPENAAQIASAIMAGEPLMKAICTAIEDD